MELTQNALLNALGAYASDDGSNSDSESSMGTDASPQPTAPRQADSQFEVESETEALKGIFVGPHAEYTSDEESGGDNTFQTEVTHGVSEEELFAYHKTKRDLDLLLGCDRVPEFSQLPPDVAECSSELQAKFQQWYRLRQQGANFNDALMRNKTFKNPNIYRCLVDYLKLEESGSNLPDNGFAAARLRNDFTPNALANDQERRAREYAAKKSAESAAGNLREMEFRSVGHENVPLTSGFRSGGGPKPVSNQHASLTTGYVPTSTQHRPSMQPSSARPPDNKAFADAVERAKLIAQQLKRAKNQ
ncbi:hypothetical protein LPJ66_002210 [Kickxella alabastrina]|uniref:Uncharacterized protein n=1 Tax=Kickxella alabastrina TaxID=61397 RepID=A0ACC1IR43_9FUNG|nr:hypothetical protein LPJ66_002210 [Kickxella alabastrina]